MAVRNFWVEVEIDGRKTVLKGGGRGKQDGMLIRLYQRNKGNIKEVVNINCLPLTCYDEDNKEHIFLSTHVKNLAAGTDMTYCDDIVPLTIETER